MNEAKPFLISKKEVWEAYQRVKSNQGSAGIDGQTIEDFEKKLKKNLYKIWNRMSSGSYFPPPVRTVKIPKKTGGERSLGIPTVVDRIAQQVVKARLEPKIDPLFHPDSYGYRPGKSGRSNGSTNSHCSSVSSQRPAITVRKDALSIFSLAEIRPRTVYEMGSNTKWEIPRFWRGGSRTLRIPGVCSL